MTTKDKTSFHASNYGRFASMLPADSEGYCHLTVAAWIKAGYTQAEACERAERAKDAVRDADEALAAWRNNGG